MLKINLKICAPSVVEIQKILMQLSQFPLESNCTGMDGESIYDYNFVESDDVWVDDKEKIVIHPY